MIVCLLYRLGFMKYSEQCRTFWALLNRVCEKGNSTFVQVFLSLTACICMPSNLLVHTDQSCLVPTSLHQLQRTSGTRLAECIASKEHSSRVGGSGSCTTGTAWDPRQQCSVEWRSRWHCCTCRHPDKSASATANACMLYLVIQHLDSS